MVDIKQSMREILAAESRAIESIPVTDDYEKAIRLILAASQKGGKLVTSGMGKCGQIAENIATTFCSTGVPAVFLHPSEAQHGDLGILQKNDVNIRFTSEYRDAIYDANVIMFCVEPVEKENGRNEFRQHPS